MNNNTTTGTYPFPGQSWNCWWCQACGVIHYGQYVYHQPKQWTYPNTVTTGGTVIWNEPKKQPEYETFDEACHALAKELADLVIAKQSDYGRENILDAPGGERNGITVRLWDKICRLKNLTRPGKEPKNESITDTYMDISGYSIVALMVERGYFELPMKEDVSDDGAELQD